MKLGYKRGKWHVDGESQSAWILCRNNEKIPVYRHGARSGSKGEIYTIKDDIGMQICETDILKWLVDLGGSAVLPDDITKAKDSLKKDGYNLLSVKYRKN